MLSMPSSLRALYFENHKPWNRVLITRHDDAYVIPYSVFPLPPQVVGDMLQVVVENCRAELHRVPDTSIGIKRHFQTHSSALIQGVTFFRVNRNRSRGLWQKLLPFSRAGSSELES
jgi:hypothetical protein